MKTITATELKTKCLALLDEIARTGMPVLVTKRGKLVAQLGPPARAKYPQETLLGTVEILGDIISPPLPESDVHAAMGMIDGRVAPKGYLQQRTLGPTGASGKNKRKAARRTAPKRRSR